MNDIEKRLDEIETHLLDQKALTRALSNLLLSHIVATCDPDESTLKETLNLAERQMSAAFEQDEPQVGMHLESLIDDVRTSFGLPSIS